MNMSVVSDLESLVETLESTAAEIAGAGVDLATGAIHEALELAKSTLEKVAGE
jgi:hypothetical protein